MKEKLAKIFGMENVSFETNDCFAYSTDSSQIEGQTKAIAWPTRKEQIAELIKEALKNKWDVVTRGGGSGMAGGCVPQDSIILDISKMDKIERIDVKNKIAVVEPGVILDDLNFVLSERNLFLPVNPSSHKVCSIGGMVATNAAGNRAIKYGKTSDWTEEIEIINGKGEVLNLKGKELEEFVGTEGVLGTITKIKLKLTEPVTERTLSLFKFDQVSELMKKVEELKDDKNILSIEFFDRFTAELSGLENRYHLFIEFGSQDGEIKDENEIQKIWKMREDVGTVLSSNGYMFMEDPEIPFEKLPEFMNWSETNKIPCFGHVALGVIHQRFSKEQKNKIPEMFNLVQKLGGKVSGEHGIGIWKKDYLDRETIEKLKELKKKYDPDNLLNRGKIL